MANNIDMTEKQEAYIVSLANQLTGQTWPRYISQHKDFLGLSSSACKRVSKAQASAIIDDLKARLERAA